MTTFLKRILLGAAGVLALMVAVGFALGWYHEARNMAARIAGRPAEDEIRKLDDADRAPLTDDNRDVERRLRHPTFGFSVLWPGPEFTPEPRLAIGAGPFVQSYGFMDSRRGSALIVSILVGPGEDPAAFGAAYQARKDQLVEMTLPHGGEPASTIAEVVRWDMREAHWQGQSGQAHMRLDMYAGTFNGRRGVVVEIVALTKNNDALAPVLASFQRVAK